MDEGNPWGSRVNENGGVGVGKCAGLQLGPLEEPPGSVSKVLAVMREQN